MIRISWAIHLIEMICCTNRIALTCFRKTGMPSAFMVDGTANTVRCSMMVPCPDGETAVNGMSEPNRLVFPTTPYHR